MWILNLMRKKLLKQYKSTIITIYVHLPLIVKCELVMYIYLVPYKEFLIISDYYLRNIKFN